MGTFPQSKARQRLGFNPSTAVRANLDVRTGGQQVGRALQNLGGEVQAAGARLDRREEVRNQLRIKNRKNLDTTELRTADLEKKDLERDIEQIKKTNSPDLWDAKIQERTEKYKGNVGALDLSPDARAGLDTEIEFTDKAIADKALADATTRYQAAAIVTAEEKLTALAREGNAKSADIKEQWEVLSFNGKSTDEIRLITKAAFEAGKTLRNEDAVKALGNEAVSTPEATLDKVTLEQEARKKGIGLIPTEELSDADLVSAERVARFRIEEIKRNAIEGEKNLQEQEENKIFEGLDNGTMTTADIVNSDILDVAQKRRLLDDEVQFVKMDLQSSWPLVDNDTAVQDLNTKLTEQSSGLTDINQMHKSINDAAASGRLTKATRDKMRSDAKKGGLDAIDEQVNASTLRVKNFLIGRLTEREARFKATELSRDLTRDEQRQARSVGFLSQVGFEQLNRFNAELNKRMRETGKETLSGIEVESLAAQVWDKYKVKDDAQKIREFLEASGQRVPKPDGFSESKWSSVSDVTRANIVAAAANGMTNEQIEAMIAK